MLDDRRIKLLLILLIFLLVCAIAFIYENRAQDVVSNANIESQNNYNKIEKQRHIDSATHDSLENWKGRWMPSRSGEYTPPPKIFHKKNKTVGVLQKNMVDNDLLKNWKGRWMPSRPGEYTPPPKIFYQKNTTQQLFLANDHTRYINVGKTYICDDGVNNLAVDWDHSSTNYVCFGKKIVPDLTIAAEYYCDTIPKNYRVMHRCMSEIIEYVEDVPTYGTSRPVWPAYGEYKYVPMQRWLHSLEHGAIVMLYHPCANPLEVERLKRLIKTCLKRYVISPNNFLTEERPLALLSWGCKLSMSRVDESSIKQFIQDNAFREPKERFDEGNYVDQLMEKAKLVSGDKDKNPCPETCQTQCH